MAATALVVRGLAECFAYGCLGRALRSTGLLNAGDGETALQFATFVTLPSLMLQAFQRGAELSLAWATVPVTAAVLTSLTTAISWLYFNGRHPRERAMLSGASVGLSLAIVGYPLLETALGITGIQIGVLYDVINAVAVYGISYLLFGSAGPAFPAVFRHEDGGVYRGQWQGRSKQGLGVYVYPSKARYEGEWRGNAKDGRGVYYYPSGGMYEGEWSNGERSGTGVRIFKSGKVKAGRWSGGELQTPLELSQCANAVEGAREAALAARRVEVGGGTLTDALQRVLTFVPLWLGLAAIGLNIWRIPLPPLMNAVSAPLASANKPLMLMAFGILFDIALPSRAQLRDASAVLAIRTVPALIAGAVGLGLAPARLLPVVCGALICALAPAPAQVASYAHTFRLNESLAVSITRLTTAVSLVLLPLLAVATSAVVYGAESGVIQRLALVAIVAVSATGLAAAAVVLRSMPVTDRKLVKMTLGARPIFDKSDADSAASLSKALEQVLESATATTKQQQLSNAEVIATPPEQLQLSEEQADSPDDILGDLQAGNDQSGLNMDEGVAGEGGDAGPSAGSSTAAQAIRPSHRCNEVPMLKGNRRGAWVAARSMRKESARKASRHTCRACAPRAQLRSIACRV